MKKAFIVVAVLCFALAANAYSTKPKPFEGCPPEGRGKITATHPHGELSKPKQDLNLLKNRDTPPDVIDHSVTLARILTPSEDKSFKNLMGAEIVGYVAHVKRGEAKETCNCSRKDIADIHIEVVLNEADKDISSKYMIVEISPRFQAELGNLASVKSALQGHWVKFTGWMMNDVVHRTNAKNTNPHGKNIWRATSWEIHPVTAFKVVTAPG
ncbi:MAG TPA: hypothetical protein VIF64_19355 [Pyrinomonadaceae bacterium]|jgi:hypothetical protein